MACVIEHIYRINIIFKYTPVSNMIVFKIICMQSYYKIKVKNTFILNLYHVIRERMPKILIPLLSHLLYFVPCDFSISIYVSPVRMYKPTINIILNSHPKPKIEMI